MRFIKSTSATIIFKGIAMSCGLAISVLVGRTLGPEGRGVYGLIMTVVILSTNFGLFGMTGANSYLVGNDINRSRSVGIFSLATGLIGAALTISLILLLGHSKFSVSEGLPSNLLIPTFFLIPIFLLGSLFANAYLGQGKIIGFNLFESGEKVILLAIGVACLAMAKTGLETFLALGVSAISVFLALYIIVYFIKSPTGPLINTGLISPAITYSVRSYVATVLTYFVMKSGIFFVAHILGTAEAGQYSTAQQLAEMMVIVPSVIGTVLFSAIARGEKSSLTASVVRAATAIMLPITLILALTRKFVVVTLFGIDFLPAADIFLILLPGTFILGLEVLMSSEIAGRGYPWPAALAWLPTLVLNIAGYSLLIPIMGTKGAALSTTISFCAIFSIILVYYRKLTSQTLSDLFVIKGEDISIIKGAIKSVFAIKRHSKEVSIDVTTPIPHKSPAKVERVSAKV
jgi:O-antigen/teichoic acid export membrane protein